MIDSFDDTIAALASPPGPAARGIIRIGGPNVRRALDVLFVPDDAVSAERGMRHAELQDSSDTALRAPRSALCASRSSPRRYPGHLLLDTSLPLPAALYLWPTDCSYTGQPLAELHLPGSPPLLECMLGRLFDAGVRPARPGEFTLRAFLSGRVDLVQAEAVLGVIDAHDHVELQLALRQLAGGVSTRIAVVRGDLLDLLADLEAGLDFADEDIEFIDAATLSRRLTSACDALKTLLKQADERMHSTGRLTVVLAGLPNAGKSTLFNALAGRAAALVSADEGTTRDYLSAEMTWNGTPVELIDTAGWELSADGVMQAAQGLRNEQIERADLVLWCSPPALDDTRRAIDEQNVQTLAQQRRAVLRVYTKADIGIADCGLRIADSEARDSQLGALNPGSCTAPRSALHTPSSVSPLSESAIRNPESAIQVSARTGDGLDRLRDTVLAQLARPHRGERQLLGTTAARCRESLSSAIAALHRATENAERGTGNAEREAGNAECETECPDLRPPTSDFRAPRSALRAPSFPFPAELVAIELRDALGHLGRIVGAVYTDDILDRIFSRFCIGK